MSKAPENRQMEVTCENGVWTRNIEPPGDNWRIFGQTILERMKRVPERVGQIDGLTGEKDTYASMVDRAVRCALWLRKQAIKPGEFIGIATHNLLDTFVPILAAIFTGVVFYPWWGVGLDDDRVKHFLKLGEPKVMFVTKELAQIIQEGIDNLGMTTKVIVFEDTPDEISLHDVLKEQNAVDVENFECTKIEDMNQPAVMISTSGTTGFPKGVLHTYCWLEKCSWIIPDTYIINSISLCCAGIYWISGLGYTISLLTNCATAVIYSNPTVETVCQLTEKYKIHNLVMGTAMATSIYKYRTDNPHDLSSVKYVIFGGTGISRDVDQSMKEIFPYAVLCLAYGTTEVGAIVGRDDSQGKLCCIGRIRENFQIKVVDVVSEETLGVNKQGEVKIKSPYMMLRYHKDPKNTSEAIDANGWFRTGDLGFYDADGDFFIVDRMKEIIKYKKLISIVPLVIEEVILKHPGVSEVGVVAKPDLIDVEQPMAFVTIRSGFKVTEDEIIKHVEETLPDHMKLRGGVKILEKMPITPSGKISRIFLREMAKTLANV